MNKFILKRGKIALEDINVGTTTFTGKRNRESVELTQLNASNLLGLLVVKSLEDLTTLNPDLLTIKSVYVQDDAAIYTYDVDTKTWSTDYGTMQIVDTYEGLATVPDGYKVAFNLQDSRLYYKDNNVWLASGSALQVIPNTSALADVPAGISIVIISETGQLYHRGALNQWEAIAFDMEGDPIIIVDTVDALPSNPIITTALVKDDKRGGIFKYDATQVGNSDGGLNFNGWLRQFASDVSVLWYGAVGDGVTDDTAALVAALKNKNVVIPNGNYVCRGTIAVDHDIIITANNATITLESNGNIQLIGSIDTATQFQVGQLQLGATTISVDNRNFNADDVVQIYDASADFGQHNKHAAQISKVLSKSGSLSLELYEALQYNYTDAFIRKLNAIRVRIEGLSIVNNTNLTALTLGVIATSSFVSCTIVSSAATAISMSTSSNIEFLHCNIYATGVGSINGLKLKDVDKVVLDTSTVYGSAAIKVEADKGMSNSIAAYKSIITSSATSIDCEGNVNGLLISDCRLRGQVTFGGYGLDITKSSIISHGPCVVFRYLVGGTLRFSDSSFTGLSTATLNLFITHSSSNTLYSEAMKLTTPIRYSLENCMFNDATGKYLGAIECIATPATSTKSAIKSTLTMNNISYTGVATSMVQLVRLSGPFVSVRITATDSGDKPLCSVRDVYDNNSSAFTDFVTKYFNTSNFYTDMSYITSGTYGYSVSDNITPSLQNKGYRIIADAKAAILKNLTINGKDLELLARGNELAFAGTTTKKSVDRKYCLEVYLGNTSGIPSSQTVTDLVMVLSNAIALTDAKINAGVI